LYAGQTAVNIQGNSPEIVETSHNEVRYFHWAGLDSHKKNVWIHDNVVEGGGHQGIGVRYTTIAEHNTVLRASTWIGIEDADHAIIRNNTIIDCPVGIGLRSGTSVDVFDNTIQKIHGYPDGWYYQGKLIYPADAAGRGAIVNSIGGDIKIENNNISI
jgi:nitrous oxidase accessory protein NosD